MRSLLLVILLCIILPSCVIVDEANDIPTMRLAQVTTTRYIERPVITVVSVIPPATVVTPDPPKPATVVTPDPPKPKRIIKNTLITAYCPCKRCCGPRARGRTATGANAWVLPGVAADWRFYPPGTILYIPSYGKCVVDDKGGKVKGRFHFDVRELYHWQARERGNKYEEVEILELPEHNPYER